jgi:2-(3-amino-3-carboxypropyl)histidine synthase
MNILHIPAKYTQSFALPQEFAQQLPSPLIVFTTTQFIDALPTITKQLEDAGKKVILLQPRHTSCKGQILGCSTNLSLEHDVLYLGTGIFHPKSLVLRNNITVYTYNPLTREQQSYSPDAAHAIRKKVKGAYAAFLMAKHVGVLITLKPGQQKAYMTEKLAEQYPDKTFYYFVDNTFSLASLQDFPFIDMFLNTMCERMGYDDMDVEGLTLLNIEDLWALRTDEF